MIGQHKAIPLLAVLFALWLVPNAIPLAIHLAWLKWSWHGRHAVFYRVMLWVAVGALNCTTFVVLWRDSTTGISSLELPWDLVREAAVVSVPLIGYALFMFHTGLPPGWRKRVAIISVTVVLTLLVSLVLLVVAGEDFIARPVYFGLRSVLMPSDRP